MTKKRKPKKKEKSPFSVLADAIVNGPCGFCGAKVMQGAKHKDGCPVTKKR
jgi:hypothetical protein